jgi:hypothetical protein
LGPYGTTEEAGWLFNGTLNIDDNTEIDDATRSILLKLKKYAGNLSDYITIDDLRQGYAKWRESTSTSPSGLHLGHEKALL